MKAVIAILSLCFVSTDCGWAFVNRSEKDAVMLKRKLQAKPMKSDDEVDEIIAAELAEKNAEILKKVQERRDAWTRELDGEFSKAGDANNTKRDTYNLKENIEQKSDRKTSTISFKKRLLGFLVTILGFVVVVIVIKRKNNV